MSINVVDLAGMFSDEIEIQLDDRDNAIALPPTGDQITVKLGWGGQGLVFSGRYFVDEVDVESPPDTMKISGRAANNPQAIKAQKTRHWDDTTLGAIVSQVASEHGYIPQVVGDIGDLQIKHLDQTDESDMHLLTRLAKEYGAVSKPVNNAWLFARPGEADSAGEKTLPVIHVKRGGDVSRIWAGKADRFKYNGARAAWHDQEGGERRYETVGSEPIYQLRHTYKTAGEAIQAADARRRSLSRGLGAIELTVLGNPEAAAEAQLVVSGFREGMDGEWLIKRVEHNVSGQSFTTKIEGELPQ